jgi:hypothetical protein
MGLPLAHKKNPHKYHVWEEEKTIWLRDHHTGTLAHVGPHPPPPMDGYDDGDETATSTTVIQPATASSTKATAFAAFFFFSFFFAAFSRHFCVLVSFVESLLTRDVSI